MKVEYTEQQIIQLAIEKNLTDGEELETKHYIEKGYINNDRSLVYFIEKLEQYFESVTLKLNPRSNKGKGDRPFAGSKRIYIAGAVRDEIITREIKNGKQDSEEEIDFAMSILSYIYDYDLSGATHSLSAWSKIMMNDNDLLSDELDVIFKTNANLKQKLNNFYRLEHTEFYNEAKIRNEFISDYNRKLKSSLRSAFNYLSKNNLVEHTVDYAGRNEDGTEQIDKKLFNDFRALRKQLIEETVYSHAYFAQNTAEMNRYNKLSDAQKNVVSIEKRENIENFTKVFNEIENKLVEKFGYKFVYETHTLEVIADDFDGLDDVEHYYNTLYLRKTYIYRYKNYKSHYVDSTYFYRAFFYLSASLLLDNLDEEVASTFEIDLERYIENYKLNYLFYKRENFGAVELSDKTIATLNARRNQQVDELLEQVNIENELHSVNEKYVDRRELEHSTSQLVELDFDDVLSTFDNTQKKKEVYFNH